MLDLNLILAIAHHLAVFVLVAIFAAEFALLRPGIEGKRLMQLGKIDGAYGAVAGLVVVVGIIRVIFGGAGWEYYAGNWVSGPRCSPSSASASSPFRPPSPSSGGASPAPPHPTAM